MGCIFGGLTKVFELAGEALVVEHGSTFFHFASACATASERFFAIGNFSEIGELVSAEQLFATLSHFVEASISRSINGIGHLVGFYSSFETALVFRFEE